MMNKHILIKLREQKSNFRKGQLNRIREKENDNVTSIKVESVSDLIFTIQYLMFTLEDILLRQDIATFEEIETIRFC